jgi:vacuolar-type H+-ATPase subunit H
VTPNLVQDRKSPPESRTTDVPVVHPDQALQVLNLAQRTADEHIAEARRDAEQLRDEAQAAADKISRDAHGYAHRVRSEADKLLADARATAEEAARKVRIRAEEAQRSAGQLMAQAEAQAETVTADALRRAEHLKLQAEQRYEDTVAGLSTQRTALQQQIEALEQFDRDYRTRLATFMQSQMRALWAEKPQVGKELEAPLPQLPAKATT